MGNVEAAGIIGDAWRYLPRPWGPWERSPRVGGDPPGFLGSDEFGLLSSPPWVISRKSENPQGPSWIWLARLASQAGQPAGGWRSQPAGLGCLDSWDVWPAGLAEAARHARLATWLAGRPTMREIFFSGPPPCMKNCHYLHPTSLHEICTRFLA